MSMKETARDGFLESDGYRIFYREFGEDTRGTLLCVHGGPGMTHDYILPLSDLMRDGYRVVFYDALGCGRSELPKDPSKFNLEHDLRVLDDVRRFLGPGDVHLMGSSYGGLLVLKYATRWSDRIRSVTSTGGLSDVPFAVAEMNRLKSLLPKKVRAVMEDCEGRGAFSDPTYLATVLEFYRRHLCRLDPWPPEVAYSMDHISQPVYLTMNGPNEFTIVGNIRDIDFTDELHQINVPTLLIHGKYDEVTPAVGERIHEQIPGSRLVILPRSSHMGFWEERERYMDLVRTHLKSSSEVPAGTKPR